MPQDTIFRQSRRIYFISQVLGGLYVKFTFLYAFLFQALVEKNLIWRDIAWQLSEVYGTERTKDDVSKSAQAS